MSAAAKRKSGAPPKLVGGARQVLYLDAESLALAEQFGHKGNLSDGVRVALRFLRDAKAAGRAGAEQVGEEG